MSRARVRERSHLNCISLHPCVPKLGSVIGSDTVLRIGSVSIFTLIIVIVNSNEFPLLLSYDAAAPPGDQGTIASPPSLVHVLINLLA